jgi:hypothetical protein
MSNGHGPLAIETDDGMVYLNSYHCGADEYTISVSWSSHDNFIDIRSEAMCVDAEFDTVGIQSRAATGIAARILRAAMHSELPGAEENDRHEAVCRHPDYTAAMRFCDAIIGDDREVNRIGLYDGWSLDQLKARATALESAIRAINPDDPILTKLPSDTNDLDPFAIAPAVPF